MCVFCGSPADSKEHVFARRLIDRMQLNQYPVRLGHRLENDVKFRPRHSLNALRCRAVCGSCNNGWMSELEAWFQKAAGDLVEPTWPILADAMIEELQRQGRMLAKWCLKTAIMIDRSGIRPKIPPSIASKLFDDLLPPSLNVQLAKIRSAGLESRFAPGFMMMNGDEPIAWRGHKEGLAFQTLIQLNHLGIRVFCAPQARAFHVRPDVMLIRAYPPRKFSSADHFQYDSLNQFMSNLVLKVGTDSRGRSIFQ